MLKISKKRFITIIACLFVLIIPNMVFAGTLEAGDKIYFGEFWNTPVSPSRALDTKELEKVQNADFVRIELRDFMTGIEDPYVSCAEIDGEVYVRRDTRLGSSYYKTAPIRWRVLDVSDGKAFLLADYVLLPTGVHYNSSDIVTWETASLRSFLNGYSSDSNVAKADFIRFNFLDIAFTKDEQKAIFHTDMRDKIFLPSIEEITTYLATDEDRRMKDQTPYVGYLYSYYLRTAGDEDGTFALVNAGGTVVVDGADANNNNLGIAPSMIVDLSQFDFVDIGEQNTYRAIVKADTSEKLSPILPFMDVTEQYWYYDAIRLAYQNDLMLGMNDTEFAPMGDVTVAQAIVMACRVHNEKYKRKEEFVESSPWYQVYIDYAIREGIIQSHDFSNYDRSITRSEIAYLFENALPDTNYLEINSISALPDVDMQTPYADSIFRLYRAGVLRGSGENGIFYPERNITRAETAAIIIRVRLQEERLNFVLR